MSDDQDSVGFDLAAWEAPPAPEVADAVLAKMREPVGAAAIEPVGPPRGRWWIAGGAIAVAAGMITVLALRGEPLTGSGAVATAKPSRVDLGATSSADLEANTDVRWVRDGHRVVAMQPRGTANWRVAPEDKLVIDAGATVASVVASGASLRVEVQMHVTEARLLAGSAVVSAAVALVTVVVYEGQVEVTGGGRTTTVAPGATVEIRPHTRPSEPVTVAGVERLNQLDLERRRLIAAMQRQSADLDELRKLREELERKDREIQQLVDTVTKTVGPSPKQTRRDPDAVDRRLLDAWDANRARCGGSYEGRFDVTLTISPSGRPTEVEVEVHPRNDTVDTCFTAAIRLVDFGPDSTTTTSRVSLAISLDGFAVIGNAPARRLTATDIDKVMTANRGAILACRDGYEGEIQVVMTVASSGAVTKADVQPFGAKMVACLKRTIERFNFGINTGGGFSYTIALKPAALDRCADVAYVTDTEAKADTALASGAYAWGLALFEEILKCKPALQTKAYMAACKARNFPKAKLHFRGLHQNLAQICLNQGFDPRSP